MHIGIVGCGIRGQLFAEALASEDSVTVTAMADPSERARTAAKERLGDDITLFDNIDALYDSGIDAVIVATPDFAHVEPAVAAAKRGLHLMIEKPLATSSEQARLIRKEIERHGVTCLVAFENRWNPHFVKLRRMIEDGQLGKIVSVHGVLSNTFFVPERMLSWSSASSPAWFLMPHTLDLAMWMTGSKPVDVTARGTRGVLAERGIDTWDTIDALVVMESGAVASLRSSWVLPESSPNIVDFRLEVVGTEGSARIDMNDQGITTNTDRHATHWALPHHTDGEDAGMAQWMVRSWARSLASRTVSAPGADHGQIVTDTIETIHRLAAEAHSPAH